MKSEFIGNFSVLHSSSFFSKLLSGPVMEDGTRTDPCQLFLYMNV